MSEDLISRRAAIDKFEPWLKVNGYSEGELNMLKAVLYELKLLPSAQQWIPVSSNPITTGLYLVLCNEWGHNRYRICAYYGEAGKWIENGKNITKSITYWMPLPEPWEGGAEMKGERNECID